MSSVSNKEQNANKISIKLRVKLINDLYKCKMLLIEMSILILQGFKDSRNFIDLKTHIR